MSRSAAAANSGAATVPPHGYRHREQTVQTHLSKSHVASEVRRAATRLNEAIMLFTKWFYLTEVGVKGNV
jgi:hypothetical protein